MMQNEKETIKTILSRICFTFTPNNFKFFSVNKNVIVKKNERQCANFDRICFVLNI